MTRRLLCTGGASARTVADVPDLRLDAATLQRRRDAIRWTQKHECGSTLGMTLIIVVRAASGELVVAADGRTSVSDEDGDGRLVISDTSLKLIDFDGAIIGVAGQSYAEAMFIIRAFIAEDVRDKNSCIRLSGKLKDHYVERYSGDIVKWPRVDVTYCDRQGERGRIVRLASRSGFVPEDIDHTPHFSGAALTAFDVLAIFGLGNASVVHSERFCLLSLVATAALDPGVGGKPTLWILNNEGIIKRTDAEIEAVAASVNESLAGIRERLYP